MLHRITLRLARHPQFPTGSDRHGYELIAPLTGHGELDPVEWRNHRAECRVRRFWAGLPDRAGKFICHFSRSGAASWSIDYDRKTHADDEPGIRLDRHRFIPGEYVTFADGKEEHAFQITAVEPLAKASST